MERQIILSESELSALIQKEINKTAKAQQKTLFSQVSVDKQDFLSENSQHEVSNIKFYICNFNGEKIRISRLDGPYSPLSQMNEIGESTHQDIRSDTVHELIRKLTLAIYGVRKNKDMQPRDYQRAVEEYKTFANLYFMFYKQRLSELDELS